MPRSPANEKSEIFATFPLNSRTITSQEGTKPSERHSGGPSPPRKFGNRIYGAGPWKLPSPRACGGPPGHVTRLAALPLWPARSSSHPAGPPPGTLLAQEPPYPPPVSSPRALRPPPAGAPPRPARPGSRRGRQARRPGPRRGKGGPSPPLTAGYAEKETQRRPRQRGPTPAPAGS